MAESKISYLEAHDIYVRAWNSFMPRPPTEAEIFACVGVAALETWFGQGWKSPPHAPDMKDSKNHGAIQCVTHKKLFKRYGVGRMPSLKDMGLPSAVEGCCAMCVDSSPTPQGPSWYTAPYKYYSTHEDAAAGVIALLERMGVLDIARKERTVWAVSQLMYQKRYYQGFSTVPQEAIEAHAKSLGLHCSKLALALDPKTGRNEGLSLSSKPAKEAVAVDRNPPAEPYVIQAPVIHETEKDILGLGIIGMLEGLK